MSELPDGRTNGGVEIEKWVTFYVMEAGSTDPPQLKCPAMEGQLLGASSQLLC